MTAKSKSKKQPFVWVVEELGPKGYEPSSTWRIRKDAMADRIYKSRYCIGKVRVRKYVRSE